MSYVVQGVVVLLDIYLFFFLATFFFSFLRVLVCMIMGRREMIANLNIWFDQNFVFLRAVCL
jgi:dolichyl-phosphate-mannose--protein O-mannosyl transferase